MQYVSFFPVVSGLGNGSHQFSAPVGLQNQAAGLSHSPHFALPLSSVVGWSEEWEAQKAEITG